MSLSTRLSELSLEPRSLPDEHLVAAVLSGQDDAFAVLMRRHNQRLYRLIRAITKDPVAAEDALQQAYVSAYRHLGQFERRSQFRTWLTRIAINEALRSRRSAARAADLESRVARSAVVERPRSPEDRASGKEWARLLEKAIDGLQEEYRAVLVLRLIERLDTDATADILEISPQNVRIRLHRARRLIKDRLFQQVGDAITEVYEFGGKRCDRTVHNVMQRLFS
jgi:RNA polymerase sigma-70 factor (ECF subfamily)